MKKIFISSFIIAALFFIPNLSFGAEHTQNLSFDEKYQDRQFIFLLYDIDIKINKDWSYITKVHKKAKVLKVESRELGEIPIYYEKDREKVSNIQAFTITSDGKKHRYSKIQDFRIYEGYPMYSDSMVKIITLPEVVVSSILEHEFTVTSTGLLIKNAFWNLFYVDSPVPMKELKFSITMPKSLGIKYKEFGLTRKPKITEHNSSITYSWALQDVYDSREDENYLPPPTPESIKEGFEFSSINSWRDISDWYAGLIKKNLKINTDVEETVKKVTAGKENIKDKTRAILEYLQKNFRYVSMSFGDNSLEPHPTDEVFKNKYGDCKDLSLLTMAMLKSTGIDSKICLFNTEFSLNDPQYDLPIPSLFDHVILLVKDSKECDFYIDPLLDGYDIGEFPAGFQSAYTFIITDDGGQFGKFPVFDEKRNYTASKRLITIEDNGSALIESEVLWDLDSSIEQRRKLNAMNNEQKQKFYEALDAYVSSGGEMLERRIEGLDQKYGRLKAFSKIRRKDEFPITDGMIVIDVTGYGRGLDFTKKERKNHIFYPANSLDEEISVYRIPKGFNISYMPGSLDLDIGFFSVKREYAKGQNEIKIIETTRYKRMQLSKEEYGRIKAFFDQLPTKTQQRIMLKKAQ